MAPQTRPVDPVALGDVDPSQVWPAGLAPDAALRELAARLGAVEDHLDLYPEPSTDDHGAAGSPVQPAGRLIQPGESVPATGAGPAGTVTTGAVAPDDTSQARDQADADEWAAFQAWKASQSAATLSPDDGPDLGTPFDYDRDTGHDE